MSSSTPDWTVVGDVDQPGESPAAPICFRLACLTIARSADRDDHRCRLAVDVVVGGDSLGVGARRRRGHRGRPASSRRPGCRRSRPPRRASTRAVATIVAAVPAGRRLAAGIEHVSCCPLIAATRRRRGDPLERVGQVVDHGHGVGEVDLTLADVGDGDRVRERRLLAGRRHEPGIVLRQLEVGTHRQHRCLRRGGRPAGANRPGTHAKWQGSPTSRRRPPTPSRRSCAWCRAPRRAHASNSHVVEAPGASDRGHAELPRIRRRGRRIGRRRA